jgi:hypothetical protein
MRICQYRNCNNNINHMRTNAKFCSRNCKSCERKYKSNERKKIDKKLNEGLL